MATSIRVSLLTTGLAYYTFAAAWVWARSAELNIRPFTGLVPKKTLVGAAEGFIVGGVGAALLFAGIRVAVGRPLLDPSTALLTTQGNVVLLLLGILLIAVAAPVVEELVFRGFLAEAFRDRGKRVAVLVSAVVSASPTSACRSSAITSASASCWRSSTGDAAWSVRSRPTARSTAC